MDGLEMIEALRLSPGDIVVIRGGDEPDEGMLEELAAATKRFIIWLGPEMEIWSHTREELQMMLDDYDMHQNSLEE